MTAEYFSVGGKLTAVVGQLTILENSRCCRSTAGLREFHKFCRSSDVDSISAPLFIDIYYLDSDGGHCPKGQINHKVIAMVCLFFYSSII